MDMKISFDDVECTDENKEKYAKMMETAVGQGVCACALLHVNASNILGWFRCYVLRLLREWDSAG